VIAGATCDQGRNESAEQGFAESAHIVHKLREAEIVRQLVFRDAPMGATAGLAMVVVYTDRDDIRRITAARVANRKERAQWLKLSA